MSHTPAPWTWWTSNSWKRLLHDLGHGRSANVLQPYVCCDGHPDCEVNEADMNLIASAPLLLVGCKAALEMVDGNGAPPDWDWLRKIVAKAEGRALPE